MMEQKLRMQQGISVIRCSGYTVFRRRDSIIQLNFDQGHNVTLDDAKNQVNIFRQMNAAEKCVIMAVFEEDNTFGKDVREFISSSEVSAVIKADALVVKGLALKILTNGYLQINRPDRPTKVFTSTPAAVKWLHQYI
jgi:hypothetical protein